MINPQPIPSANPLVNPLVNPMPPDALDLSDPATLRRLLGVPDSPDGYQITCDHHRLFDPDPAINERLHAAHFTPEQAQLVYDLAAQHLMPALQELVAEFEAEREQQRLVEHFGGDDKWREISRQLLAWGRKNLPEPAVEALTTTFEGVLALHRMMSGGEPAPFRTATGGSTSLAESELHQMMRDPRYWRDRDPTFIAQVTEGFRRHYGAAG